LHPHQHAQNLEDAVQPSERFIKSALATCVVKTKKFVKKFKNVLHQLQKEKNPKNFLKNV
jgi:hypothetical protein